MALVLALCIVALILIVIVMKGNTTPEAALIAEFYEAQGVVITEGGWCPPKKVYDIQKQSLPDFLSWMKAKGIRGVQLDSLLCSSSIVYLNGKVNDETKYSELWMFLEDVVDEEPSNGNE